MTDARFPERWLNDRRVLRLSDSAFRLFVTGLAWSVSNRTDGRLYPDDLALLSRVDAADVAELASSGRDGQEPLWPATQDGGWDIAEFAITQTTSTQLKGLEHKRAGDRERKARQRAHERGDHRLCLPEHCPGVTRDVTPDRTRDTKDRPGQDRQLQGGGPMNGDPRFWKTPSEMASNE